MLRILLLVLTLQATTFAAPIRALIIDGRNNHDWENTTDALQAILESTGKFQVTISTAPELKIPHNPRRPKTDDPTTLAEFEKYNTAHQKLHDKTREDFKQIWQTWQPDFASHDVVILNYNGPDWPEKTRQSFTDYIKKGGGVLLVHAANNGFGNWDEFNQIIGLGWRPKLFGKAIKIDPKTGASYQDKQAGASSHGSKHAFPVTVRQPDHPIMRGLPPTWMHGRDELYHDMRGVGENLTILSSAYSDPAQRGSEKHEPITWETQFGQGRAIVTTMGHFWRGQTDWDGLHCVGFQTIIARSCEYLATGIVTLTLPENFPSATEPSIATPHTLTKKLPHHTAAKTSATEKKQANPYCQLTPAESLATFDLAPGYIAEPFATEPQVQEPVLTVFDGNGVMYVAEMRSYMQDIEGTATKTAKNGRIKRLEDTDGDGRADKVTIFVDNLNLPRAILPLDDRIAVRETDSMDVIAYRDTDGDGIADQKEMLYKRGGYGRGNVGTSVEHQDSGLVWNIDNHIYLSYNIERYRFTDGTWQAERQRGHWTQWGLTHNDSGDLYWIHNSDPAVYPHLHPKYWANINRLAGKAIHGVPIDMGAPYPDGFLQSESLCLLDDRGGSAPALRAFTSACGQSIFRGHKLAPEDRGDYFFCDPTIHVVRRSNLSKKDGLDHFEKAEPGSAEFLRSPDINSRFINTATGPDGCLYVTDMYRGIIQDAPWLSPGPRENIVANGLDKHIQHGRIWRIRHADHAPGKQPQMLSETTAQLVRHLAHPNGWWRDTAQRMIILRKDRETVTPLLKGAAQFSQNSLERLHALWTLEGIAKLDPDFTLARLADRDPRVRRAAIQIAERWIDQKEVASALTQHANEKDPTVAQQLPLTLGMAKQVPADPIQKIARKHSKDRGVMLAVGASLWGQKELPFVKEVANTEWQTVFDNWSRGLDFPKEMDKDHQRLVRDGELLYFKACVSCHGADGRGKQIPGTDFYLAPSLVGSKRISGDPDHLVPILLHGLIGPLDGKAYQAGFMAPAKTLGLDRERDIAQVLSYLRWTFNEQTGAITEAQVKEIKAATADRKTPWTQPELEAR